MKTKDICDTYLFPNGNVCTFDGNGEQIPELQGKYSVELHRKIIKRSNDKTNFNGFSKIILID